MQYMSSSTWKVEDIRNDGNSHANNSDYLRIFRILLKTCRSRVQSTNISDVRSLLLWYLSSRLKSHKLRRRTIANLIEWEFIIQHKKNPLKLFHIATNSQSLVAHSWYFYSTEILEVKSTVTKEFWLVYCSNKTHEL